MKKLLILLILLLLIISFIPASIFADTENETISGEGTDTDGTYVGGAANYTNLNTNNGDTAYLNLIPLGTPQYHTYNFTNIAFSVDAINSVTLYYRAKEVGGSCSTTAYCIIGGNRYYGSIQSITSSYATYSYTWSQNPATAVDWTTAEINAAEFGLKASSPDSGQTRWTYTYLHIDYELTDAPSVTTSAANNVTATSVTLNGEVTNDGGDTIDFRGFVYDTVSRVNPGNTTPPATYANNWTEGGTFGEGSFDYNLMGLVQGQLYYFRAFAHNSQGWDYGDELQVQTLDDPEIQTNTANNIGYNSAQLNSTILEDGGESCTIAFAWDLTNNGPFANFAAFGNSETLTATYSEGEKPYLDIDGLEGLADYTFMVSVQNTISTQYGNQLTFETTYLLNEPIDLQAKPNARDVDLSWVKGDGATYTDIRYKTDTYPSFTITGSDGIQTVVGVGTDSRIDCGAIHNGDAKTWYSIWFKLNFSVPSGVASSDYQLWYKSNAGDFVLLSLHDSVIAGSSKLHLQRVNGPPVYNVYSAETSWNANQWYHVIVSMSNVNGVRMIVDGGVPVTNVSLTGMPAGGNFYITGTDIYGFPGVINNISCGNDDLLVAEEVALYGSGYPGTGTIPADATEIYLCDDGIGDTVTDTGTGGNDGTLGIDAEWYNLSGYPNGSLVYLGTGASTNHSGLTPGTTYYYSAWSVSDGIYSDLYATAMATTLATDPVSDPYPEPSTPSNWWNEPDATRMENNPLYVAINDLADDYSIPHGTMWFLVAIFMSTILALIAYNASHNPFIATIVLGVCVVLSGVFGIMSGWIAYPAGVLAVMVGVVAWRF